MTKNDNVANKHGIIMKYLTSPTTSTTGPMTSDAIISPANIAVLIVATAMPSTIGGLGDPDILD